MRCMLSLLLVVLVGCSSPVARGFDADAGEDAGADAATCTCGFHWLRIAKSGDPPIECYARGECSPDAVCVPVEPLTEDPRCQLR